MAGLSGALLSSVSTLSSNSTAVSVFSNNISNLNTTGYKGSNTTFSSLVTGTGGGGSGGGTFARTRSEVSQQGLLQPTGVGTDLSISGAGFFVVKDTAGNTFYTRAGSFREDDTGNLVNSARFRLQGWPLDNEGRLPGAAGNSNTISAQLLESLRDVNLRGQTGQAFGTSNLTLALNLDASEDVLKGAGDDINFDLSPVNYNRTVASGDIIVPTGTTTNRLQSGDTFTVAPGLTPSYTYTYGGFSNSIDISAGLFGATTPTAIFSPGAGLTEGDAFTIQAGGNAAVRFTFKQFSPISDLRQFNSLQSLSDAINTVTGLTSRVVNNRLYVSSTDANDAINFATTTNTVSGGASTANWPVSLGLGNVAGGTSRFNTLAGLKALIDVSDGIGATLFSPANDSSLRIFVKDPKDTITFSDSTGGTPPGVLNEFGLPTTTLAPVYDPLAANGDNLASGVIASPFTRNIRIFDSLGIGHDIRAGFVKSGNNEWEVEFYAANPSEIISNNPNGIIAYGTLLFNGDGTLRSASPLLSGQINIVWANQAQSSTLQLNLGTAGLTGVGQADGLRQFAGPYTVTKSDQNGAPSGELSSLEVTKEGDVIAKFTNGESRKVFRIPLASFPNPNGLLQSSGNVYIPSNDSGEFSLNEIGAAQVGDIVPEALEGSTVDLATELTGMIVAQRSYQAGTKAITTVDNMLEELARI
ncbi:MAG: flagellar hook-basal body complex protein [Proteobacteria bacterium]|nr:flagellar hook-basal body complex protein [Pseudomonadota bacterium]